MGSAFFQETFRGEDLNRVLASIRRDPRFAPHIIDWRTMPSRQGRYAPWPKDLHPRLKSYLAAQGLERAFSHQAEAVSHALKGESIAIVTPTASGKTLCYNLPVLDRLLRKEDICALYLFPTKALANDQLEGLERDLEGLSLQAAAHTYDGDTPSSQRRMIREATRLLITNPDMLHVGILPYHVQWRAFLGRLAFVVLDEMHTYRGIFGSHVAHVLRRLKRLCAFYGSMPQFIVTSATIANPIELAEGLLGVRPVLIQEQGAPTGERHVILYNPPITNERLGLRRSPLVDARELALTMVAHGQQAVCFMRSRLAVEEMVIALRQQAAAWGLDPEAFRGYRAGYLASERRSIEEGLRKGRVRCVVATSALELGIDIGSLTVAILVGYPGSISSTWQRIGRVGRRTDSSAAFLIASDLPLDQYIMAHPEHLFQGVPEAAYINPQNPYVRFAHERAALYELPFEESQVACDEEMSYLLATLEAQGEARQSRGRWFWAGIGFPAGEISLRCAEAARVTILSQTPQSTETIGEMDKASAPRWLHEGAIYLHEGEQFLSHRLDLEKGIAQVEPVRVDYYTIASENTEVQIEHVLKTWELDRMVNSLGKIRLTRQVTSYRRQSLRTQEVLGWGPVDLPPQEMSTTAFWLSPRPEVIAFLERRGLWIAALNGSRGPNWEQQRDLARARDGFRCRLCGIPERAGHRHDVHHIIPFQEFGWIPGKNDSYLLANQLSNLITLCPHCHRIAERQVAIASTLVDIGYTLRHLAPLWLLCDPADIGLHVDSAGGRAAESPTLFIYDQIPGGAGLVEYLPERILSILKHAHESIAFCACESGCPSCIGPTLSPTPNRKQNALALLESLLSA